MRVLAIAIAIALMLMLGCSHGPYVCTASDQCLDRGVQGTCRSEGFCSFPDPECPSGERFEPNAGGGFGGTCVSPTDGNPDGGTCGAVGMACCAGDTCGGNAFCDAGTCRQCITDVALGLQHSCVLRYDGTVWCSGRNDEGELGTGSVGGPPTTSWVQARDSTNAAIHDASAIGAGHFHACAARAGGAVWCWGEGSRGQLGDNSTTDRSTAVAVTRASDDQPLTGVVELQGTYGYTCARDSTGGLWCWGDTDNGHLGDGTAMAGVYRSQAAPVLTVAGGPAFAGAMSLTVGDQHACTRRGNEIWCWGDNFDGQIGNDSRIEQHVPVQVFAGTSVAAGRFHTCAVKADGSVWCWGAGNQGRLGNGEGDRDGGDLLSRQLPVPALTAPGGPPFAGASTVAAGALSCAVMANKDAYCWGVNYYGQTGTGAGTYVPRPVLRLDGTPLHDVDRMVAAYTRACAFLTNGELVCWGRNSEGELADGTLLNRGHATPMKLSCP